jgi:hypothetical protein
MPAPPITRILLYKHGVGYFEREGVVEGDASLTLGFRQDEVSDVLKSLLALDLDGGHISTVSYDSTKPREQLLADVALSIPDKDSLIGLLPQLKGTRVAVRPRGVGAVEGLLLGVDRAKWPAGEGVMEATLISVLADAGLVRSFVWHELDGVEVLDEAVRRDLEFYLRTELSSKKKDARQFTILARGSGRRTVRLGYTVGAPVWKATYRMVLGEEDQPPRIQGWAVVDNTTDEDWVDVQLSLVSGLPVSFLHDLYTPRYIRRPEVEVEETTGVLPPIVEEGIPELLGAAPAAVKAVSPGVRSFAVREDRLSAGVARGAARSAISSAPAQVRERQLGDLFSYEIEHPVTIRRNQSALVPIVLRPFRGRTVLLYNKANRAENPMRSVEFENSTGLTLEGGPVTVLEGGDYVGEAMLETVKPDDLRLVPYAVELGVRVTDSIDSQEQDVTRVVIRRGSMTLHSARTLKTTYTLRNKSEAEQVVYLEHPRANREWTLYDTPEPVEVTENHWRFRFPLPPKSTTAFVVRQRVPIALFHTLAALDDEQLGAFFRRRYFDEATESVLRQLVELRQQQARLDAEAQALQVEREAIFQDQVRIRQNLNALGDRPSEKGLRERLVGTLNAQEDRLVAIERERAELLRRVEEARARLDEGLAGIEFEAAV